MEPQRDIRKLNGVEPLRKKESPSKVYVGHSSIISDFAEKETRGKKKNRPVVGIHLGDVVPPVWGQEMDYHFTLHNPSELVGRFPPLTQKMSFVEATGLDRADEIIFICINPDRGIFYGEDSAPEIPIHFVSTLLERIPKERLKGKKVKVIYNEESEIEGQSPVGDELKGCLH